MHLMIIGLALFIGAHGLPIMPSRRDALIAKIGPNAYKGLFSLVALVGLVLIVWGYGISREDDLTLLYDPPYFLRHVAMLLMLPVFILLASAFVHGRITTIVRHPMVLAIKLWAFAHLLANGELSSVILFGAFLIWAIFARISLARRERQGRVTVQGGPIRNDVIAVVAGLVLYIAFIMKVHMWLIGKPII